MVAFGIKKQDPKKFFKKNHLWWFAGQNRVVGPLGAQNGVFRVKNQYQGKLLCLEHLKWLWMAKYTLL